MQIEVITFQDWRKLKIPNDQVIVTVSKSKTWSRGLSPFILGPCKLYDGNISKNMENAWQYSKVYPEFLVNGVVSDAYMDWAKRGWDRQEAHRYPMGKDARPLFSLWSGQRYDYVPARKKIYIPLYYKAVRHTEAFKRLQEHYERSKRDNLDLYLVDFDAYRHKSMGRTYRDVINDPNRKMGHAFVLAMMLEIPERLNRAITYIAQNKDVIETKF
ncbi:MAG: hypothetical protein WC375_09030 [Methanomassiliicoccales archaeon]|jgi:hypothetical protein